MLENSGYTWWSYRQRGFKKNNGFRLDQFYMNSHSQKLFKSGEKDISPKLADSPDFIFLLANYHHYSSVLQEECASLPDECKFYISSFMGYGLYKDFVLSKCKLKEIFPIVFNK